MRAALHLLPAAISAASNDCRRRLPLVLLPCNDTGTTRVAFTLIVHTYRSKRGADRAAFKNRWKAVQDRVRSICNTRKPSPKPSLEACVAILDEAASLPPPEQAPGGAWVPHDIALSPFRLRSAICSVHVVVTVYLLARICELQDAAALPGIWQVCWRKLCARVVEQFGAR